MLDTTFLASGTLQIALLAVFFIFQVSLLVAIIFLFQAKRKAEKKMTLFFGDKEARDLEKILTEQLSEIKVLDQEIQELFEVSNRLRDLSMKSIHKVSVERFNPFKEVGSNQSFCVALLDGKNTGVVISSLHTREGTRVYAKPVAEGQAKGFPFTDEEKETVIRASQSTKKIAS